MNEPTGHGVMDIGYYRETLVIRLARLYLIRPWLKQWVEAAPLVSLVQLVEMQQLVEAGIRGTADDCREAGIAQETLYQMHVLGEQAR